MMRRIPARPAPLALLLALVLGWAGRALGEVPGYLFRVEQPISSEQVDRIGRAADRILRIEADRGGEAVLVFEFGPGSSDFGVCIQLADLIARDLGAAKATVAYLPESVSGYALFPAFACDEIVAGASTAIGPLYREESEPSEVLKTFAKDLAPRKGRPVELLLGMLDPESDLGTLNGPDGQISLVDRKAIRRDDRRDTDFEPLWIAGAPGSFTADRGRSEGFIRAVVEDRGGLESLYELGRLVEEELSGNGERTAYWVRVSGRFDAPQAAYLKRQLARAASAEARVIILQLDTAGGDLRLADQMAVRIARIERATTVAYIRDRAIGVPALLALACDEIIVHRDGVFGAIAEGDGRPGAEALDPEQVDLLATRAVALATEKRHSTLLAEAMVRPEIELVAAPEAGGPAVRGGAAGAARGRIVKRADQTLTLSAANLGDFGLDATIVESDDAMLELLRVDPKSVKVRGPIWVDSLIATLNTPLMGGVLLFLGFFMLVLEMKLPGIGLPAIMATLAFLLFFWSRYLGGIAGSLEIILFIAGLISLAVELFLLPGFGVFGVTGIVLMLSSIVMANQTFLIPSNTSEVRQSAETVLQLFISLGLAVAVAIVIGRYLPSLPVVNKLILMGEPVRHDFDDGTKFEEDLTPSYGFLIGESGRSLTALRPVGKARFGGLTIDVHAVGHYIERDRLVVVVEVQGPRVIVEPM